MGAGSILRKNIMKTNQTKTKRQTNSQSIAADPPPRQPSNPPIQKSANPPIQKSNNPPTQESINPPIHKSNNPANLVLVAHPVSPSHAVAMIEARPLAPSPSPGLPQAAP